MVSALILYTYTYLAKIRITKKKERKREKNGRLKRNEKWEEIGSEAAEEILRK